MIRISSNYMVQRYQKDLNELDYTKAKLMEQGDGKKLHRPSDNSVDYSRYLRYNVSEGENDRYQASVKAGISWMNTTQTALSSMEDIQKTFKAELTLSGSPATGFTVDKVAQASEAATVEGPRSLVNQVVHIVGHINLNGQSSNYNSTVTLFALNAEGREVSGITLTPPSTEVTVNLARGLSRKVVEVQAKAQSDLPPQLKLEGITVEPSRIEIAGAEDVIRKITSIATEEFSLSHVRETEQRQVRLALPEGVTVTDPNVTVEIKVGAMQ